MNMIANMDQDINVMSWNINVMNWRHSHDKDFTVGMTLKRNYHLSYIKINPGYRKQNVLL